ncbi:type IV pilus modification protein PilV [Pseudomonas abietaniphila]|uniref:type IV pilus modification protein PilV n=1 Tax=Pseudomonas abietaniphila TaxID=89065 RepID=UPI000A5A5410|nr:type IV pilus modification protein PilV [Pseudomonas abietaniphila]
MRNAPYQSAGFSLVEVLVSMLIIAVGVLGMVALQSKAIPYTQDSVQRNTAIMLVDDVVEMIRTAGSCTTANGCIKPPGSSFPAAPGSCNPTPATLSEQIGCWAAQAGRALPGGAGLLANAFYICRSATPGDVGAAACGTSSPLNTEVEIQVAWTVKSASDCLDNNQGANPTASATTCTYRIRTRVSSR